MSLINFKKKNKNKIEIKEWNPGLRQYFIPQFDIKTKEELLAAFEAGMPVAVYHKKTGKTQMCDCEHMHIKAL